MRYGGSISCAIALIAISACSCDNSGPFVWQTREMCDEPVLFVDDGDGRPKAELLLEARAVRQVTDCGGGIVYETGRDYMLGRDGRSLILPASSRIPFLHQQEMYPPSGAVNSIAAKVGSDRHLLFSEGDLFPKLQARVTYEHCGWDGPVPPCAGDCLPGTLRRLREGKLRVVLFGDSISAGCNATSVIGIEPRRPAFGEQVAAGLRERFGAEVELVNESVGGKDAEWGLANIGNVTRHGADLVIIGWGMNDASGHRPSEIYVSLILQQMAHVRQIRPDVEFLLIATLTANPEWTFDGGELYQSYLRELGKLRGPGVAVADMTTLWQWVLSRKRFVDVTGNGVNHPNDFGHTLYTQLLLATIEGDR